MNAIPTKTCVGCGVCMPLADFPMRDAGSRRDSRCEPCRKRYWREAHDRSRLRRGKRVGVLKPRVVNLAPSMPAARPFVPPADFLPMGEADRSVVLRWSVGVQA